MADYDPWIVCDASAAFSESVMFRVSYLVLALHGRVSQLLGVAAGALRRRGGGRLLAAALLRAPPVAVNQWRCSLR